MKRAMTRIHKPPYPSEVLRAYRLADAFGMIPELWAGKQLQYDLYQAGKLKRAKIERMGA